MRLLLCFSLLSVVPTLKANDEPKTPTAKEQYETLIKEYETAYDAWRKTGAGLTPENPLLIKFHEADPSFDFAPRLLRFAEANLKDPVAVDALLRILKLPWAREKYIYPSYRRALEILTRDFLLEPRVVKSFLSNPVLDGYGLETYFRELLAQSPDHEVLGRACMCLVECDQRRGRVAARPYFDFTAQDHPNWAEYSKFVGSRLDPEYIRYFRETDQAALDDEVESLLERVARDFGDIPMLPGEMQAKRKETRSLADYAKEKLFAIQSLGVGQVAPEIIGKGLDGQPLKLSDFRGKVVMLVFWGTWCGPCMRMVSHEKEMVERLKGRPFTLVGVNAEVDLAKSKGIIQEKGITWPSFQDGSPERSPIARRWNVRGWPTIYILDEKGVIRHKNLPHHVPQLLDEKVDELLKNLEH